MPGCSACKSLILPWIKGGSPWRWEQLMRHGQSCTNQPPIRETVVDPAQSFQKAPRSQCIWLFLEGHRLERSCIQFTVPASASIAWFRGAYVYLAHTEGTLQ